MVGDVGDDAEIMRDHHDRGVVLLLEGADQLEDLRLHRDVECSRRLISNEQGWRVDERHGDHHSLPHASRQLVRVVVDPGLRVGDPDPVEHVEHLLAGLLLAHLLVHEHSLGELGADSVERVQARHRILEDHRHRTAALVAHLVVAHRDEIAPLEPSVAGDHAEPPVNEAHDRLGRHALA